MKHSTTKKGFTLIELMIVLAIFSIILVLVISFIDPVSRIMTKTSVRERTASYVDNIGDYLDKSLRYAKFVRVYEGNYGDRETTDLSVIDEKTAVQAFVDDFFDGALGSDNNALKGKVHVLQLYNDDLNGDMPSGDKPGVVYESTWSFTAGDSCPISWSFSTHNPEDPTETEAKPGRAFEGEKGKIWYDVGGPYEECYEMECPEGDFPRSQIERIAISDSTIDFDKYNRPVINPEHFVDYSYYYVYGYYQLEPVPPSELDSYKVGEDSISTSEKYYYSQIVPMLQSDGVTEMTSESADNFALNVIAYQNNSKGINMINAEYSGVDPAKPVALFRSPSYMSTSSMSLTNCVASGLSGNTQYERYFRVSQNTYTGSGTVSVNKDSDGNVLLEAIDPKDYNGRTFQVINTKKKNASVKSNNIYIIFALPDEVSPSRITFD